ncbi:MAG: (5-formylfuran-3-yl)methyl phosphate synthase [Methylovulum sp.]|uniref:(5-formylfuran-3-yl)methyl phosphate synthase n=1 Tax=Methylovulum sp. TaxID=1916980 RepID=UPI002601C49E|nr:(5-formylfuran-3-yl)methyl phosphate synthase [Methylovulum sp.]MDD2724025.1 (5-formylfuran-3-yl)methyl phosphate synthase [Methylovulum sp.]MDD5126018.1 (5-formylfuran-3-yl)methyl phosphate synthase [Methylovulum sp.]
MTGMLASVKSVEEALLVLEAQVDIIDLKQPAHGALGALDTDTVLHIVKAINHRCPVSATIGDLPMQPEVVFFAAKVMAATGVDYIKIGFFPEGDWMAIIEKLAVLTPHHALIAVLFADAQPDLGVIKELKKAGFKGVMLDTMNKRKGSLTKVMTEVEICRFITLAKKRSLLCGLAGSLRKSDIARLLVFKPDYLGFRGALCLAHERGGLLNEAAIGAIRRAVRAMPKEADGDAG